MRYSVSVKLNKDFIEVDGNIIRLGVMARPKKGKANEAIIKKLAAYFKVPPSRIRIISGFKSRNKIIEIE